MFEKKCFEDFFKYIDDVSVKDLINNHFKLPKTTNIDMQKVRYHEKLKPEKKNPVDDFTLEIPSENCTKNLLSQNAEQSKNYKYFEINGQIYSQKNLQKLHELIPKISILKKQKEDLTLFFRILKNFKLGNSETEFDCEIFNEKDKLLEFLGDLELDTTLYPPGLLPVHDSYLFFPNELFNNEIITAYSKILNLEEQKSQSGQIIIPEISEPFSKIDDIINKVHKVKKKVERISNNIEWLTAQTSKNTEIHIQNGIKQLDMENEKLTILKLEQQSTISDSIQTIKDAMCLNFSSDNRNLFTKLFFVLNPRRIHWIFFEMDFKEQKVNIYDSYEHNHFLNYVIESVKTFVKNLLQILDQDENEQLKKIYIPSETNKKSKFFDFNKWECEPFPLGDQQDSVSCGPFTLLQIENLLNSGDVTKFTESKIRREGRYKIFLEIVKSKFENSDSETN